MRFLGVKTHSRHLVYTSSPFPQYAAVLFTVARAAQFTSFLAVASCGLLPRASSPGERPAGRDIQISSSQMSFYQISFWVVICVSRPLPLKVDGILRKPCKRSSGSGKMIVLFFSAAISVNVCR